jgi:streptomycin 6-kinase
MPPDIPERFRIDTEVRLGLEGRDWLTRLPDLIAACEREWAISTGPAFPLSFNYVAPATTRSGGHTVLKLSPYREDLAHEAAALRAFDGRGAVRLLAHNQPRGALLMRRAMPGQTLQDLDQSVALEAACGVMKTLWRPPPAEYPFPTVDRWGLAFPRYERRFPDGGPLPSGIVERGGATFRELLESSEGGLLLHGDLHYENILNAGPDTWLAIDPKGVVGEGAYEPAALLRNRLDEIRRSPTPRASMERRVGTIADLLDFDAHRVRAWGFAQAVLSVLWSVESNETNYGEVLWAAELLSQQA